MLICAPSSLGCEVITPSQRIYDALNVLAVVDDLLKQRGYKQDSSARHNLSIAISQLKDAQRQLWA